MSAYWYPSEKRARVIAAELSACREIAAHVAPKAQTDLAHISETLERAADTSGFPLRQLPQWVWIASQWRLSAETGGELAGIAGAALVWLDRRLSAPLGEGDVQDLNWVADSTVRKLSELVGPTALRSCLSIDELDRIEAKLSTYSGLERASAEELRPAVERQVARLRAVSTDRYLATLDEKIEALFAALNDKSERGAAARAALRYLADEEDVIGDAAGFLGLLDDVYVVEWAYAVVESQTRCLPLLRDLVAKYPYVADVPLIGRSVDPLDIYSQYVACAALEALFGSEDALVLVVREAGPFGLICAFMAAVESARAVGRSLDAELAKWSRGDPILISDGAVVLKAVYLGVTSIEDKTRYTLGVRGGSITVPPGIMPYMSRAAEAHGRLSKGNEILEWLKARRVDPLVALTGTSRTRAEHQDCILLVGPRHRLDQYINDLRPLGSLAGTLVGLRYINSHGRHEDLGGVASDTPFIYACSDIETANELIRDPPPHVARWRLIVDGARSAVGLRAALSAGGEDSPPNVCVLAELHDRENVRELTSQGLPVLYIEDQDVEAPPLVPKRSAPEDGALVRALSRQANHWAVARRTHPAHNSFLEAVADWLRRLNTQHRADEALDGLAFSVSAFLQKAISTPLSLEPADSSLQGLAKSIQMMAASHRLYSPLAAELANLFRDGFSADTLASDRGSDLLAVLRESSSDEEVAVVCRSARTAEQCDAKSLTEPALERCVWLNMEALRRTAPYDRLIVPGWLDRMSMRELMNCGYAGKIDLILYPFEQRWFDAMADAGSRWERKLEQRSVATLARLSERAGGRGRKSRLWGGQTDARLEPTSVASDELVVDDADAPEFEKLEARAIETMHAMVMRGREHHPTARAQLVLFEEPGAYAYLPPTGRVIVLSNGSGAMTSVAEKGDAERMLFRSVADLEPGFVVALPIRGDRDLIDARADQFIDQASKVRATASLWKHALRRFLLRTGQQPAEFARRLKSAGISRDAATVRYWVGDSQTVAPRGYREAIPVLAKLTDDEELCTKITDVLSAIDLVYRARAQAAQAIVQELFSGSIDLDQGHLTVDIGGGRLEFALHRVRRLEGVQEVPVEIIGKARRLEDAAIGSDSANTGVDA